MILSKQRIEQRTVIAVQARMRFLDRDEEVMVANASSHGLLVVISAPPRKGTPVEIQGDRFGLTL